LVSMLTPSRVGPRQDGQLSAWPAAVNDKPIAIAINIAEK